jgi:hypothetical protein
MDTCVHNHLNNFPPSSCVLLVFDFLACPHWSKIELYGDYQQTNFQLVILSSMEGLKSSSIENSLAMKSYNGESQ